MARDHKVIGVVAIVVLLAGATAVVAANLTSLAQLVRALDAARWPWIAAGVAVHAVYFVAYAVLYRLGFRIVGVASRTWQLVPIMFAGLFVNVVVPTGAGSAALFIDDAARRGESAASAAVGVVLVLMLDLLTLLPFVAWGVWFLVSGGLVTAWQVVAIAMYVGYVLLLAGMIVFARVRERTVCRALDAVRRLAAKVRRRPVLSESWPADTTARFAAAASAINGQRRSVAIAALWATVMHVINLVGLWMFLRGFGVATPMGALIAAFALGIVFFVIVVVPQVAPVVEAVMIAIFREAGVGAGHAVAVTLAFRVVNFWLPLALGLAFVARVRRFGRR